MKHAVNITPDAILGTTLDGLALLGAVTTPHPRTPRYVLVDAPVEAAEAIGNVDGVCGCCDPDHPVELAEVVEQQLTPDMWNLDWLTSPMGDNIFRLGAAGEGVTICNVDTPAENIDAFGNRFEKIYDHYGVPNTETHGTKTLDAAGGAVHGPARKALLRNFAGFSGAGAANTASINAAMSAACDYVEDFPTPNGAVLSLSILTSGLFMANPFAAVTARAVSLGIILVAASGNGAGPNNDGFNLETSTTKAWPALDPNAIRVGSLHDGAWSWFSNYPVDIHGPGYKFTLTAPGEIDEESSGTSYACPTVGGVIACGMSDGITDVEAWLAGNAITITGVQAGTNAAVQLPVEGISALAALEIEGGDASTEGHIFEIDGGDASTIYSPQHVMEEANG